MANRQKPSTILHGALWVVQVLLAASLVWSAWIKLVWPIAQLAAMWPWVGQIPATLVKLTGIVDFLGTIGLIVPSLLRIQPKLTPIAAVCILVLMICASTFHVLRGEASVIGVNNVFALLATFVAWGRFMKAPIPAK
ncbi:DoxX family protein [Spirosoma sp. BT702]|uniref:DoxX family protein n=2 Tax=Spirosoma profusum TaxID=2771354 RepID=A0A926XWI6_9BACT|nr:DoxX family protein [Spirosoma profusum]